MRATQSSTASFELFESLELRRESERGAYAALQFVSRSLDLSMIGSAGFSEPGARRAVPASTDTNRPFEGSLASEAILQDCQLSDGLGTVHWIEGCLPSPAVEGAGGASSQRGGGVADGSGLVHDMGNLLGALGLYAELLAMPGVLHEDFLGYAQELRQLSERSTAMMARLVDRQKQENDSAFVLISEVVARMHGLLHRVAGRAIEVEFGEGSERFVNVSEEAVERILTNLVKNAGEAMKTSEGRITVRVEASGTDLEPRVVLSVTDEGCGMNSAQLGSLGGSAQPGTNGRGLGFRVVRELAAITGGMLGIASEPGHGTTVTVEWNAVEQMDIETAGAMRRVMRGAAGWIGC